MDGMRNNTQTARHGNSSELYPIMTSVGRPQRQETGGTEGNSRRPPNVPQYNSTQENSVPLSHLRNEGGGYLGPAALEEINQEYLATQSRPNQDRNGVPGRLNNNVPANHKCPVEGSINADSFASQSEQQKENPSVNCRNRTSCEKILLMGGSILLIIIIALAAGMVVLEGRGFSNIVSGGFLNDSGTCQTRDCVRAAGAILESIDETAQPCEDFVQFTCGGWYATHPIPETMHKWSVLDVLDENTLYEVKSIIEEKPTENESIPVTAARKVYQACVDDTQWSKVGLSPLLHLLDEVGGLPMIEPSWKPESFRLEDTLAWMRRAGGQSIVALMVSPELTNNSHNVINLMQGLLPIPIASLTNATELQRANHISFILKTVEAMLTAKGLENDEYALQQALIDTDAMWNFTVALAKISEETMEDPWKNYNPMSVTELSKLTNHPNSTAVKIDWLLYFKHLFNGTNITVGGDDTVIVHDPWYFGNLTSLLNKTTTRTIANYLLYQMVYSVADETSTTLRDVYRSYENPVWEFGRTSLRPWYDCVTKVRILLPMALGQMFFKKHSIESVTDDANKLVGHVADAFRIMLRSATWMSNETTSKAVRKLDEMVHFVAYPDYLLDDEELNEHMEGLPEVSESDHFGNVMTLLRWHGLKSLAKLNSAPSRSKWPTGPVEINAFYSTLTNAIIIPGGILQPQFFHGGLAALNYGGVGAIIGHEITHGFDNNGRHFDWDGRLAHWWDEKTMEQYVNRSKCFEEQYSSYNVSDLLAPFDVVLESLKINGLQSKGENLADNGGVRAAWAAYKKHIQETGEDLVLPGLQNYTQDQLFFITFGRLWCMQYTPWALKYSLANDLHPPGHYRILGSLQNTKEFSETFGCAKGSKMNPEKKCLLW